MAKVNAAHIRSESRRRTVAELTSDIFYSYEVARDGGMTLEWMGGSFADADIRLGPASTAGGCWYDRSVSEDRPILERRMPTLLAGEPTVEEFRITDDRDEVRWLRVVVRPEWSDEKGRVVRFVGAAQDITELKHREWELAEKTALLEAMIESLDQGVSLVSPDLKFVAFNRRLMEIFGVPVGMFRPGDSLESVVRYVAEHRQDGVGDVDQFVEEYLERARRGEPVFAEQTRPDGTTIEARRRRTPSGHNVTVYNDVTERKRAERAHWQAGKMEALIPLAEGVAHDFNNVLLAITALASKVRKSLPDDSQARNAIDGVVEACGLGRDLVQQVTAISHHTEPQSQPGKLHGSIDEALNMARASLPPRITWRQRLDESCGSVAADPTQMRRVVINLIANASDAIGANDGVIEVVYEEVFVDHSLAAEQPELGAGRYARLLVTDTGCGMESDTVDRIFDPFFTTKKIGAGTGLGLSIANGIVVGYGGSILVDSEPGRGTTMAVYLPVSERATGGC